MSKKIKLSEEEFKKLQSFKEQNDQLIYRLGNVNFQQAILEGQRSSVLDKLADLQEESNKVGKELQDKYGEGTISLDTGEITLAK
tara:strand:+ start:957 stop:1211 length:255 start_codon:yes stop_codon:yes gene_type:complete